MHDRRIVRRAITFPDNGFERRRHHRRRSTSTYRSIAAMRLGDSLRIFDHANARLPRVSLT